MEGEAPCVKMREGIPTHVAPDRIFDFDFVDDPLLKPDPHDGLLELARRAPSIFYTPRYGGSWVIQGHDAIFHVVHDPSTFSSGNPGYRRLPPIMMDPPEHAAYRSALLHAFAPKTVNAMLPSIRQLSVDLIEKVAGAGRCDFMTDIAEPLPVIIFMRMLGLPTEQLPEFRALVVAFLKEGDRAKGDAIFDELLKLIDPVIAARMTKREDDIISRLLDARIGTRSTTVDEIQRYLLFLTSAGLDTVTNAMGFGMRHLASDAELQDRVRADLKLVPTVLEEFLRRYAPSTIFRTVTRDTDYEGAQFRAGDRVHLLVPAANLDPAIFHHPDQIVLDRDVPPVTFGTGIHRCLGSHLARLEMRNIFTEWLTRIPSFRIDPDTCERMHAGLVYSVDSLPLVWNSGVRRAV